MKVLALLSAVLRVIGNCVKLLKIIGGNLMDKMMSVSNTIIKKLTNGVETLLVAGNLGGVCPAACYRRLGRFPPPGHI